jgi:fucose permease
MGKKYSVVVLILLIFFVISLMQNMLGPLIPDIIDGFDISLTLAGFLPFSFFIAYAVMSIPTGFLIEKFREKIIMVAGFIISFSGALLFATKPTYLFALLSLFMMGTGVAMLQVAINPLLRVAGGEKHFAFNSVLAQFIFGSASFISPMIYIYFIRNIQDKGSPDPGIIRLLTRIVPENLPWVSMYWVFVVVTLFMIFIIAAIKMPEVELTEDERIGQKNNFIALLRNRFVLLYFFGIIAYVGTEQGVANWISKFLATYHNFDPQSIGAKTVSNFWGLMTIGCILGLFLLKLIDSRKVLIFFSVAAIIALTAALFGSGTVALVAFPLVGFFASVMWSIIFSLALNSVSKYHGTFSGILCTGICGGAIVPFIIGWLGNRFGLRFGMLFIYLTMGYILSVGFWAKPLINNATVILKKNKSE